MKSTKVIWILQYKIHKDADWKQWSAYETRSRAREGQKAIRRRYKYTRIVREEVR